MKKQMIPALVGFWAGHVVTSVLLFGWIMLGILWYFMGTSDLWYDVTAILNSPIGTLIDVVGTPTLLFYTSEGGGVVKGTG